MEEMDCLGPQGLAQSSISWHSKRPRLLPTQQQQHTPYQQQQDHRTQRQQHGFSQPAPLGFDTRSAAASLLGSGPPAAAAAPVAAAAGGGGSWNTRQAGGRQQSQQQQSQQLQQSTLGASWPALQPSSHTAGGGRLGRPSNADALWGGDVVQGAGTAEIIPSSGHCKHMQLQQQWQQWPETGPEQLQHSHQQQLQPSHQQQQWVWGSSAGFDHQHDYDQQQEWADLQQEWADLQQEDEQGVQGQEGGGQSDDEDGQGSEVEEQQEVQKEEEEEVQLETADFDLSRDTIIARIEQLAFDLISGVAAGQLPTLTCISTARSNVHMAPCNSLATQAGASTATQALDCGSDQEPDVYGSDNTAAGGGFGGVSQQQEEQEEHVLRLGSKVQVKSLLTSAGAQTNSIVRALQLLDSCHALLRSGRSSTQRDVYYNLVGRPGFQCTRDVSDAIRSVLGVLRVPRAALGISASSKGAVAGCVLMRGRPGEAWVDCRSVGASGRPIPGEVGAVDATAFRPAGARCILVVEKDAVFQSLVESRLHEQLPCIIITGRGMPDVASRAFLASLVKASREWGTAAAAGGGFGSSNSFVSQAGSQRQPPALPVLGLVDWNPGGVSILLAYKYGCAALGLESARYAVPSLSWLGVTSLMLQDGCVPQSRCHALSDRHRTLMPGLKLRLASNPSWVQELEEMEASGLKADIEALQHEDLMKQIQQRILQGSYLR